jgi:hypothetical protein
VTPRIAGVLLLVAAVAAGVGAGWLLSVPPWGVPAAFLLAAATIGALVGVLWLQRRSWEDKTWPPAPRERDAAESTRRSFRVLGIVLAVAAPGLAALGVVLLREDGRGWSGVRILVFALVYAVAAVAFLRAGRRRPAPVDETRAPGDVVAEVPADAEGWRPVGRVGNTVVLYSAPVAILSFMLTVQLFQLTRELPGVALLIGLGVAAGAVLVVVLVVRRRAGRVIAVHLERRRVRVGRREAGWDEIAEADLRTSDGWPGQARSLALLLKAEGGPVVPVALRRNGRLALSPGETALVARVVEGSRIEIPRAKEDPRGRFSRTLFPTHVTKDEALTLIADPPGSADPLPTAGQGTR